jgi:hypothetical protein
MTAETCSTCRYRPAYACQRFPPIWTGEKDWINTFRQPPVDDNGWCGEWVAKAKERPHADR